MRILAIRGRNLASLAQEFEVDFRLEPLASAGLFVITGATGAGKSTLLDALCLALYDDTPRLARATARGVDLPDVRDETIAPGDPRSILRRGAADGFAEVDFVGNDGVGYRARWNVRRARNKPDGKLQPSEMSIVRIADGQPMAGHLKTEVLPEIQRRIGLSFAQFTRAVLLAQNDFAAFLKASDDERAELLQTLTGTDLFSDISRRAFERNKAERELLQRQLEQLADQRPLEMEARGELEAERAKLRGGLLALEKQKADVEGYLRWHEAWEQAKQAEIAAGDTLEKALADKASATERQANFIRIEAIQPARPLITELDRLDTELEQGRKSLALAEVAAAGAIKGREEAENLLREAGQSLQSAEQAKAAAGPDIERAKELDTQIKMMEPNFEAARKAVEDAREAAAKVDKEAQARIEEVKQTETALQATRRWLSENASLQSLGESWIRWETLLGHAGTALVELIRAQKDLSALKKDEQEKRQACAMTKERQGAADKDVAANQQRLEDANRTYAQFDPEALVSRKKALEIRRDLLIEGEQTWRQLENQRNRHGQLDAKAKELNGNILRSQQLLEAAKARKPDAERDVAQAERSLRIAEAACHGSVEQLRKALEPETPCPVCGSVAHPYAAGDSQLRAVLGGLQAEAERCRKMLEAVAQQEAVQYSLVASGQKQLAELKVELSSLGEEIVRSQRGWAEHVISRELAALSDVPQGAWFAGQLEAISRQLESIEQEEKACRQAGRQQEAARQAMEKARDVQIQANEQVAATTLAFQQAVQALETASGKLAELEKRLDALLNELDAAFPDSKWRTDWCLDPAAFLATKGAEAHAWNARTKGRGELESRSASLEAERKALAQTCSIAAENLGRAQDGFNTIDAGLKAKQQQRQRLFEGKTVDAVESALNRVIDDLKKVLVERQQAAQKMATEESRAGEALQQAKAQQEKRQADFAVAQAGLDKWIAEFNARTDDRLTADQLRGFLFHDAAWMASERGALQELDRAIETAQAILKERSAFRTAKELESPTRESAEALRETLAAIGKELEAARAKATAVEIELGKDDERRTRSAALLKDIEAQEAKTRVWAQLNELIGAADGKKFRNFAQQLTLDVLLGYANRHLERLSRRYRLERIQESLALLVVDQDMGGEIRSVHSLSGGESFLLSLALALGLASLSSHQVRVESLFIDEGFGSLDTEALRIAMEALDSLQAQGRKVGVISHVQEMTERIGTQIQVRRLAGGQSRLAIIDA